MSKAMFGWLSFRTNSLMVHSTEMQIESPVLFDSEGALFSEIYEMPSGCLCCSSKGDLFKLIEFFCSSQKAAISHIVIECSGVADIGSVK